MIKHSQVLPGKIPQAGAATFTVLLCTLLFSGCTSRGLFDTGDHAPPGMVDISGIKDAVPRHEPLSRYGNPASYVVYGKRYYTMPSSKGYTERGIASWYGTKFHGQRTSSGETYDMYQMTAAHKSLPLPTYVEVRNLRNGRTIVVKVNDRGPFIHDRIIDLSFVAAAKLGIQEQGTGLVEVRAIETETPLQTAQAIPATQTLPPAGAQDRLTRAVAGNKGVAAGRPVKTAAVAQQAAASRPAPAAAAPTAADRPPVQTAAVTRPVAVNKPQSRPVFLQVGAYRVYKYAEDMVRKIESNYPGSVRIAKVTDTTGPFYKVQIGPLGSTAEASRVARDLRPHGINDSHTITR